VRRAVVVIGKAPEPGRTKTRLTPPLTPDEAAALYSAFLRDTVETARSLGWDRVTVIYPPANGARAVLKRLLPGDVHLMPQPGSGLGEALSGAFVNHAAAGFDRVVLIGSDNPTLPRSLIDAGGAALDTHDIVIGPATDGGYYLIGMDRPHRTLFERINWSTSLVYGETLDRAREAGLSVASCGTWDDVDTFDDLERLRAELYHLDPTVAPFTRAELARLRIQRVRARGSSRPDTNSTPWGGSEDETGRSPSPSMPGGGPMFDGFALDWIDLPDVRIRVRHGGSGPPVLLLHGHPRTHTTWHRVAPILARDHTVVCPDLRGYGQSTAPPDRPDHSQASKRAMAGDAVAVMATLGHERFAVVGHDRGAYAALRTALDHPDRVSRLVVLDAVPIGEALARADATFAARWPHWFFFGLPDKPERAILCDPDAWYRNDQERMGAENYADYRAAIHDPETVHAMVEDYRAGLTVDSQHDQADMADGRKLSVPVLVLWASRDDLGDLYGDPLEVWRAWADDLDGYPLDSGHHMAEEIPELLAAEIDAFLHHRRRG